MTDFVILGFPKCATSALARLLATVDGLAIGYANGNLEAPFYLNPTEFEKYRHERAGISGYKNGHKYAAYIYTPSAVRRIAANNDKVLYIICVRNPKRALVSWREMHRRIALTGSPSEHFINKSEAKQRFFSEASLDDYFASWVGDRLKYADHIRRTRSIIGNARLAVVDQGLLARDPMRVKTALAAELDRNCDPAGEFATAETHVGLADKLSAPAMSAQLEAEMNAENDALNRLLVELAASSNTLVLR